MIQPAAGEQSRACPDSHNRGRSAFGVSPQGAEAAALITARVPGGTWHRVWQGGSAGV